ncbi:MAG: SpoIIE family protein phosphatase [Calditrichaeota bacterium]|nr:SpoIIE family protein phosphatase [Calditrichota bacterium]HQU72733.1 SpoIIE family protein phosphatase [Calditrichia bacterium]
MAARLLVVDDEPDLELLIKQKFRRQIREGKYEFLFAGNGQEALAVLEKEDEIGVVLTDINMPIMDGLTLIKEIAERFPRKKCVIISAYGDMPNIRTALNRGAFDFVTKPIDFNDLETTLEKTLSYALESRKAHEDHNQLVALRQELDVARRIQKSFLPDSNQILKDLSRAAVVGKMVTAKEVGGDLYDFFYVDEDHLGLVLGDVSGKGVPAAMLMAVTKILLKSVALGEKGPDGCLRRVNPVLRQETVDNMFVTLFFGILDLRSGLLSYCNAGHDPGLIVRRNGTVEIMENAAGIPLAFVPNFPYQTQTLQLETGDAIFLYTDGISESQNDREEEFGLAGMRATLENLSEGELGEKVEALHQAAVRFAQGHPQADDMTLLAVQYLGD